MAFHAYPVDHNSSHPAALVPGRQRGGLAGPCDEDPRGSRLNLTDIMVSSLPDVDLETPLNVQLEKAEAFIASSRRAMDFHRPDLAYKDYLKGFEVVVNFIPRHKDYGFFCNTKKGWEGRYKRLRHTVQEMDPKMEELRHRIRNDNARSESRSRSADPRQILTYSTEFGMPSAVLPNGIDNQSPYQGKPELAKPVMQHKPESIRGDLVENSGNSLSQRFARLRMTSKISDHLTSTNSSDGSAPGDRSQTFFPDSSHLETISPARPGGPREMPADPTRPLKPPKPPLATVSLAMPKPPSPTYKPVKNNSPSSPNPPRTSTESNGNYNDNRPTYYNQLTYGGQPVQIQRLRDDNPYRPRTPNGVHSALIAKSSSSEIPYEQAISAQTLVDYIRKYNVLIIDVRDREMFDDGHIFTKSIICIEPVALKEGVAAEELEERLVVSPESEQSLFEKRNEFDIVVYHDQNSASVQYLQGPPSENRTPALRALYDTLYEFNHYKALKDGRPPALLIGGIDAWVDLMGSNSLATSKTAALMGSTRKRILTSSKPIARQRMVSANSSLEIRKRRLRDYKPLNADEAQAWRQKAQEEEVDSNKYTQETSDGDEAEVEEMEPSSPFVHDYESFLRKFPDVAASQQSMTMPLRLPPTIPPPSRPAPTVPSAPSRPPPAVPRPSYSGQSEIIHPQAPLARQTSAMRPPLYASSSIMRRLKLPRTGLTNFGVTCYMNSTLQCLSATIPLSQFFLEDRYKEFVQHNWKGSDGIMPDLYTNLIRSLWKSDVEVIKPTTFRRFCGRMNREWAIDRQQDAKEFFDFLVDCLHEDLNVNWTRTPLKPLTAAEEMQRERTPVDRASLIEWQRFQHRDHSYVSSLFAGQHASRLKCTTCRNTSTTYEAFYSISVEIPQLGQGNVYDCLRSYCQEEMLSGDEVWKCPHCKCEREATKQIILTRLPQFLVIHFKRFSASKTESARKIHTPIEFPLYGLNMDRYMISRPTPAMDEADMKIDAAVTPPFSYDLYGVLRHLGSTGNGGHYVSLVRDTGRGIWRRYDDERAYDFDPTKLGSRNRLTNHEAYIVFYQRQIPR